MRIIVTGSRKWADKQAVCDALMEQFLKHGPFALVHGGCATGADDIAHRWFMSAGRKLGVTETPFFANWDGRGRAAGPERNKRMVEAGADLVLAFPLPEGSGTQHTMALAREAGIEIKEFTHG